MSKRAKSKVVGKPAHHAKPAAPKKAKKHAAGAASKKHQPDAHQKHLAHLAAEHTAHETHLKHIGKAPVKKRGLALGDAVACCAAEALAASLRLLGLSVTDEDVLSLYWRTASDPDAGASIWRTLEVASESGLAGFRPAFLEVGEGAESWRVAPQDHAREGVVGGFHQDLLELTPGGRIGLGQDLVRVQPAQPDACVDLAGDALPVHGLILGVELPGPHTVLATPDGWWSWGELHCPCEFPDVVIEEAWAVTWG